MIDAEVIDDRYEIMIAEPRSGRGVYLIATGEHYTKAAIRVARNIRKRSPSLSLAIATDRTDLVADLFDHVKKIEDPHKRSKVDEIANTPFEQTFYVDTDIRLLCDISEVFGLLERFDLAVAHAHARNRSLTTEIWRKPLPDAFCQFNGGLLLYSSKPGVLQLLQDWSRNYAEAGFDKDQVTLRELIWDSNVNFYVFPPEYNIRYSRYKYFWPREEASPRVLHLGLYHDEGADIGFVIKRRTKEILADFSCAGRVFLGALIKLVTLGRDDLKY